MTLRRNPVRPFGFTVEGDPVPAEIAELERVLVNLDTDENASTHSEVRRLYDAGVRAPSGAVIDRAWLKRRLADPRLRDLIADPEVWDRYMAARKERSFSVPRIRRYKLTGGKAVCKLCQKPLHAQPNSSAKRSYACRRLPGSGGCGRVRISAALLEPPVVDEVKAHLADPEVRAALQAAIDQLPDLARQVDQARDQLGEIADDYANHRIDRRYAAEASGRVEHRIARLQALMKGGELAARVVDFTPEGIEALFDSAEIDEQREVIDLLIDTVEVGPALYPGQRSAEGRLTINWRY